jgi:hypothetical protein
MRKKTIGSLRDHTHRPCLIQLVELTPDTVAEETAADKVVIAAIEDTPVPQL